MKTRNNVRLHTPFRTLKKIGDGMLHDTTTTPLSVTMKLTSLSQALKQATPASLQVSLVYRLSVEE
jgi:hypothetical protein